MFELSLVNVKKYMQSTLVLKNITFHLKGYILQLLHKNVYI